jgi:apolipoprotein N-acyltransferase
MLQWFYALRRFLFFKLAVIYLRFLIGFAFVFSSFIKIKGERFTSISVNDPVGYFFEAMYQTGMYWNFLGWSQLITGCLLMSQRFSTVGAMVFLPVILNVFMITHSIDFGMGTPLITLLMLLGTLFLLLWDYKKWIILFKPDHKIKLDLTSEPEDRFMTHPIWIITGVTFIALTAFVHLTGTKHTTVWAISMLITGLIPLPIMLVRYRKR